MTCVNKNSLNPYDWNWKLDEDPKAYYPDPEDDENYLFKPGLKLIGTRISDGEQIELNRLEDRGGTGAYGSVYIYSGKLDGEVVEVAVKQFDSQYDLEVEVLKYINGELNVCKTCPNVVCLKDFEYFGQKRKVLAMETLQNELNFQHILINQDEKSTTTTNINKSNENTKDLFKYLSNIIDAIFCLANQNLYYFDLNPRNVMIKDCEDGKTEAILIDLGSVVWSKSKEEKLVGVGSIACSYPPMYLNENEEFEYYTNTNKRSKPESSGMIQPTKVKCFKALLIFLSLILYLSLNINYDGNFVGKSIHDKDLNKIMFYSTPFSFKRKESEKFNAEDARKMFEQLKNHFSADIYNNLISGLKAETEEETKTYIKNLQKCFENKEVKEQRKAEEKLQKELQEQRKEVEKQRSSDIISRAFKRKQARGILAKLKEEKKEKEFLKLAKEKANELRSRILGKKILEAARKNVKLRKLQREKESRILKKQEKESRKLAKKDKKEMRRQRRMELKKHSEENSDEYTGRKEVKRRHLRKKECNKDQIRNPITGRCVKKSGKIGKSLLRILDKSTKIQHSSNDSPTISKPKAKSRSAKKNM